MEPEPRSAESLTQLREEVMGPIWDAVQTAYGRVKAENVLEGDVEVAVIELTEIARQIALGLDALVTMSSSWRRLCVA